MNTLRIFFVVFALLVLPALPGRAVEPTLVADLAPGERVTIGLPTALPPGALISSFELDLLASRNAAPLATGFLFAGRSPSAGVELWRSDGSEAGTTLVRDLCPGPCSASPQDLVAVGKVVYFTARLDRHSPDLTLFRSDGTRRGTVAVYGSCRGGRCFEAPRPLLAVDGELLFAAAGEDGALDLWRTDGSRAGTRRLVVPASGCRPSEVLRGAVSGRRAFLALRCGDPREELWAIDDARAVDVLTGSFLRTLTPIGGGRLAVVRTLPDPFPDGATSLWTTDGSPAGTQQVAVPTSCGPPSVLVAATPPGKLLLATGAPSLDRPFRRDCLWALESGKEPSRLLGNGVEGLEVRPLGIAPGSRSYFLALRPLESPTAGPYETEGFLGVSDGTLAQTSADVRLTPFPSQFVRLGNGVFYDADGAHRSDGTLAGTVRLTDFGVAGAAPVGGRVLFAGYDELGLQPWTSDGTPDGTRRLAAIGIGPAGSEPAGVALADRLIFAAGEYDGAALWATDGVGIERLTDLAGRPTSESFPGDSAAVLEGRAIVGVCELGIGPAPSLVTTDGTADGTEALSTEAQCARSFGRFGSDTYFAAFDGLNGTELWRTDGTPEGTALFTQIAPGDSPWGDPPYFANSDPSDFVALGDGLVFTAWSPESGRELWRTQGEEASTAQLVDLCPGLCDAFPAEVLPVPGMPDRALFVATSPDSGRELWRTDGTAESTVPLIDLRPGTASSAPHGLIPFQGAVFFFAAEAGGGESLFRTDGGEHTRRVAPLRHDGERGRVPAFARPVVIDDRLFFVVDHPRTGLELWASDGTLEGTGLVADLDRGRSSSFPGELTAVDGVLVFAAETGGRGRELWVSNGTKGGTRRLTDLAPGPASSSPAAIAATATHLVFRADDGSTGGELWAVDRSAVQSP